MNGLLVRTDRGNLSVTFDLSAFVTDWEAARKTFVTAIAERFREPLNPRPGDFSAASPTELGEAWCKCRIFGGSSSIVLRADSLALSFANIVNADYQIALEVVRGTMERLLPALQGYARQSYMVASNYHVDVVDGRADAYLAHHGSDHIGNAASKELTKEYRPTTGSPSEQGMDTGCSDAQSSSPRACKMGCSSEITPSSRCRRLRDSTRS